MPRFKTTLILCAGILIGLAAGQLLPSAQATTPETSVQTKGDHISFLIKGKEIARLDADGLQVDGALAYGAPPAARGDARQ